MHRIYKAPQAIPDHICHGIFLSGAIDMGTAENWQEPTAKKLFDRGWSVFNPRRSDWDSSWKQDIRNWRFREQVEWELKAMERAYFILQYFPAGSKAPISLLEFGLHARENKLTVACAPGYWRRGNVEVTCNFYKIPMFNTLEEAVDFVVD